MKSQRSADNIWEVTEHNPRPGIISETVEGFGMNRIIGNLCWLKWAYGPVDWAKHHYRHWWWKFYIWDFKPSPSD
jgi:hypothetical protein